VWIDVVGECFYDSVGVSDFGERVVCEVYFGVVLGYCY